MHGYGALASHGCRPSKTARLNASLHQVHKININQLQHEVRYLQWKQAHEPTETLIKSRAVVLKQHKYFRAYSGRPPGDSLASDAAVTGA